MALSRKRVCITGGAGFIGSYLVQRLIDDNDVVVYDNLHRNAIQFADVDGHPHLHFIKGDVLDYEATRKAVDGCHIVIHCAAIAGVYSVDRNAVTTMEVNMLGTHQVVKAALDVGVERFVEFSTSEVYGPFIHKGKEDDVTTIGPIGESRWVYAASKLASEHLSYAHYKEDGLPLAIVRPFNVYGPRQVGDGAIRGMILQALAQYADHPVQRRHPDSRVVLRRRFRRRRAALRGAAGGRRPRLQPRQPAGHDHELRARQHDHPADAVEVGHCFQAPSWTGSRSASARPSTRRRRCWGSSRPCRSRPAFRGRFPGTPEHLAQRLDGQTLTDHARGR